METKFQTSFIPKKPLTNIGGTTANVGMPVQRPKRVGNLLFDIGLFFFIVSLGAAGAMYAWQNISMQQQDSYKKDLADRQKQFNTDLIEELKRANTKIDTATQLLSSHIAVSNLFSIISRFTIENVRFLNLELTIGDQAREMKIFMNGQGTNLSSVAYQSDVLGALSQYGLSKVVKNPIISSPALETAGSVTFGFSASVDPATLVYMQSATSTK